MLKHQQEGQRQGSSKAQNRASAEQGHTEMLRKGAFQLSYICDRKFKERPKQKEKERRG